MSRTEYALFINGVQNNKLLRFKNVIWIEQEIIKESDAQEERDVNVAVGILSQIKDT